MKPFLFLLLILPAIARAQLKLRVINPTQYELTITFDRVGYGALVPSHETTSVWKRIDTIHTREKLEITWWRKGHQLHSCVGWFNMHTEDITNGEWYLYLYPDHLNRRRWVVYPIPKCGVQ